MGIDYYALALSTKNEAVKAAYIQSAAAIDAAQIQGWYTFAAGLLALLAGILAYRAATRDVRIQENKEVALKATYKNRIISSLRYLKQEIESPLIWSEHYSTKEDSVAVPRFKIKIPNELDSSNWKNNALLPIEAIKSIQQINENSDHFQGFLEEIIKLSLKSKEYTKRYLDFKSKTKLPDGSIDFVPNNVVEQMLSKGEEINNQIVETLEILGYDIKKENKEKDKKINEANETG